jgi:hypothetical protein
MGDLAPARPHSIVTSLFYVLQYEVGGGLGQRSEHRLEKVAVVTNPLLYVIIPPPE